MAQSTRSVIPAEVDAVYQKELLATAFPSYIHTNYGMVKDLDMNSGTDTIRMRRYGALAAATTPLTEGTTPSSTTLSVTAVTAQVLYYGAFVEITDKVSYETQDAILMDAAKLLGEQAGDTMDQVARDVLVAGTTVQYASTASSRVTVAAGMVLNKAEIVEALTTLKLNQGKYITEMVPATDGVDTQPINRAFIAFVHPQTVAYLKNNASTVGFIQVNQYPDQSSILPYEVGSIDQVRLIESTNAKVFTGAGAAGIDVYATLVLAKDAYSVTRLGAKAMKNIVKPLGSSGTADALDQRATSGWKAAFVCKICNQNWIVRIEHAIA